MVLAVISLLNRFKLVITICICLMSVKGIQMVKLPSVYHLLPVSKMRIWLLNRNGLVSGQFVWYSNYRLRFVADGNDQILKLPLLLIERGLDSKNYRTLEPLLLLLINGSTVYYHFCTVKPTPFIWITHPWF